MDRYSGQKPFLHAITKAMLGGNFLTHVRLLRKEKEAKNFNHDRGSSIIFFIISAKKLFDALEKKDEFIDVFGNINQGEQSITTRYNKSGGCQVDTPQVKDGIYAYQKRVTDYLRKLRTVRDGKNRHIVSFNFV